VIINIIFDHTIDEKLISLLRFLS